MTRLKLLPEGFYRRFNYQIVRIVTRKIPRNAGLIDPYPDSTAGKSDVRGPMEPLVMDVIDRARISGLSRLKSGHVETLHGQNK